MSGSRRDQLFKLVVWRSCGHACLSAQRTFPLHPKIAIIFAAIDQVSRSRRGHFSHFVRRHWHIDDSSGLGRCYLVLSFQQICFVVRLHFCSILLFCCLRHKRKWQSRGSLWFHEGHQDEEWTLELFSKRVLSLSWWFCYTFLGQCRSNRAGTSYKHTNKDQVTFVLWEVYPCVWVYLHICSLTSYMHEKYSGIK